MWNSNKLLLQIPQSVSLKDEKQTRLVTIRAALVNITEAHQKHIVLRRKIRSENKQLTCRALKLLVLNLLQTRETNHDQVPVSTTDTTNTNTDSLILLHFGGKKAKNSQRGIIKV